MSTNENLPDQQNANNNNNNSTQLNPALGFTFNPNQLESLKELNTMVDEGTDTRNEMEKFLQNKLNDINLSKEVKKSISFSLNKAFQCFRNSIQNNELYIKQRQNSLTEILTKQNTQKLHKLEMRDLHKKYSSETLRRLKHLKQNEEKINATLIKLEENESLLHLENKTNKVDQNIKEARLIEIAKQKKQLKNNLYEIQSQIEGILSVEKPQHHDKYKAYLANFNENRNINNYEQKAIQFEMESNKILEKLQQSYQQKQIKMEKIFKDQEKKHMELIEKMRSDEKERLSKRKADAKQKLEKTHKFIKCKLDDKIIPLYKLSQEQYENKIKEHYDGAKEMKKDKILSQDLLEEFNTQVEEYKEQRHLKKLEELEKLRELWNERENNLIEQYGVQEPEEVTNTQETIEDQKLERKNNLNKFLQNSIPVTRVSATLVEERKLNVNKSKTDKNSILTTRAHIKKKNNLHLDTKSPGSYKYETEPPKKNQITLEKQIATEIHKRPKKLIIPRVKHHPKPNERIDYLSELRNNKQRVHSDNNIINENRESKQIRNRIERYLNQDNDNSNNKIANNLVENIQMAQYETNLLDKKLEEKKQLMNVRGGYERNPELGGEIGNMIVDSIHSKLKIIQAYEL